jgi:uncharacterized damage-inducible protein DinB
MLITKQLAADLETLQTGYCWIGYNAVEILDGITFEMAVAKLYANGNTIWQTINHISYWRELLSQRLVEQQGIEGEKTGFDEPEEVTADAWEQTKKRFHCAYEQLKNAILHLDESLLYSPAGDKGSYYFNITGCMQHDAFHLGQIILIKNSILNR